MKIFYIFDIGNKRYVCKKINRSAVDLSNEMYTTSVGGGVLDAPHQHMPQNYTELIKKLAKF